MPSHLVLLSKDKTKHKQEIRYVKTKLQYKAGTGVRKKIIIIIILYYTRIKI